MSRTNSQETLAAIRNELFNVGERESTMAGFVQGLIIMSHAPEWARGLLEALTTDGLPAPSDDTMRALDQFITGHPITKISESEETHGDH